MKRFFLIIVFGLIFFRSFSQLYTDAQIKAAYIYNFALNIEWPAQQNLSEFTIAVYGNDTAVLEQLVNLAKSKKINNLPINVFNSNDIQNIIQKNPQIIFIPTAFVDQIKSIFYEVLSTTILLVSDDASQSLYVMLNFKISPITKKITFELNKKNVENQSLKILPHLLVLGGSELDQKVLYRLKEEELQKEKDIVKEQQEKLSKQQQVIDNQLISINKQEQLINTNRKSVDSLMREIRKQQDKLLLQNQHLEDLQLAVKQQQNALSKKVQELKIQQDSVERQKTLIASQREQIREKLAKLEKLNTEISESEKQLETQKSALSHLEGKMKIQRVFMFFMALIILLVLVIIFVIFRNYRQKKMLNEKLVQKNNEVEQQSEELQQINQEITVQRDQIQRQNDYITDSISYAKKILLALLPDLNVSLNDYFEHFLFYMPKNIVSGDFYWFAEFDNYKFVAVVDCTGHGVPGALLSILGSRLLSEIVIDKEIYEPNSILNMLNLAIQRILKQKKLDVDLSAKSNDGMDVVLCRFEKVDNGVEVVFSGAKRPLFYYNAKEKDFQRISGSRKVIGGLSNDKTDFENITFLASKNDILFLMTDGYIDQNNPNRKRYGTPNFVEFMKKNIHLEMPLIRDEIEKQLKNWQKAEEQRDDITILGIKVK